MDHRFDTQKRPGSVHACRQFQPKIPILSEHRLFGAQTRHKLGISFRICQFESKQIAFLRRRRRSRLWATYRKLSVDGNWNVVGSTAESPNCMDQQKKYFKNIGTYLSSFLQNTLKSNQVEVNTDTRTLKPVAKLKEPRELFALPKELDCSQQAPRWPAECQVLEERIHHIEYIPSSPELYYQPTGKEIQPKPVGEEAGTVIFQYYPMSAVNYFSRACVGGSRYFMPGCPDDRENGDDLKFESRFESGNLAKVVKITETYYELYLRTDLYTNRHMQWFYFRVQNTKKHIIYRFSFVNLSKGDSLYSVGMKPLLYSTKDAQLNAIGWRRCGDNIAYYKNDPSSEDDEEGSNYTLSFNIEFPHDQDEVYLAHCYPYTYTDLQDYLNKLQNHPIKSNFTKLRLLCRSLAGNNVYYLTITEPSVGEEPKKKKAVIVTARVHPGETPSSWMMKGFMDFLTGESDQAKELREKFIFKLVPMLNPDGVIVGNNRCSLTGRDLNRQYRTVIRETYPPVWHTKLMIRRLMDECGIAMYCDLHAHSRKHNVFIYGCENKRYIEKRLQEQVFPLMLHKNAADKFSFENCKFRIQRSKEGTGRVVVWMMGVANSYTMEASFAGSTMGSRMDTHFNVQDFESMGRAFCETLLDFCDEEPSKERLRMKIIERLLKEGSSADEPTNINLSDYSSDEGDTSSSAAECEAHKDRSTSWEHQESCNHTLVAPTRTSSSTMPKKEHQVWKQKARGSSARTQKKTISEKNPPLPRKALQIHKTTLDAPCVELINDGFDFTTEVDSGEDSSWPKGSRKFKTVERKKKIKKRPMPPELIVTPAQVYENAEVGEKEMIKGVKKCSPELKKKSTQVDLASERFRLWHHSKCLQAHSKSEKSIGELTTEIQLKLGATLKQKVWTGCPCSAIHSDVPLSKVTSLSFTHWSKGPLIWSSSFPNENTTKTFSQRLNSQQQNVPAAEDIVITHKKKKSHSKTHSSKSSKPSSQPEGDSDHGEYRKKPKKKQAKTFKDNYSSTGNDPTTQVALLKLTESKASGRKDSIEGVDKSPTKSSKMARTRLRKSGFVVTAVSRYRCDDADSESDGGPPEKSISKKKKKRKPATKKPKRVQSAKETSELASKTHAKEK